MCHVLVIEDEWLVACYLADVAERAGGTSISMAATQREAVAKARSERPGIILSDVLLREGTGPLAVETIIAEQGSIPVIFITGTPELCSPCEPPHLILEKPAEAQSLMRAFADMAPI